MRIRFVMAEIHSSLTFDFFFISPKTSSKQIIVYHSELTFLRCTNGTIETAPVFPKKQSTIWFEVIRAQTTFVGIARLRSTIHHLSRCHIFLSTAIVFFEHFLRPVNTSLFLAIVKLCVIQRE